MKRFSYVRSSPKTDWGTYALIGLGLGAVYAAYRALSGPSALPDLLTEALRTPDDILAAVEEVNPAGNPVLQPSGGTTWCNRFLALVTAKLGAPIIYGPYGTLINDQIKWMQQGNGGWYPANRADAQRAAISGRVVVATYYNFLGHGHGALVLPYPGAMMTAQAGSVNYNLGPIERGFGSIKPEFFVHD